MPKSLVKSDPDQAIRKLLFGDELNRVDMRELARRTGIPYSTLRQYRQYPGRIPMDRFKWIIKALDLEDAKIVGAIRETF